MLAQVQAASGATPTTLPAPDALRKRRVMTVPAGMVVPVRVSRTVPSVLPHCPAFTRS